MDTILNLINDWLGLVLIIVSAIFYVIFNYQDAKKWAKVWIFEAERRARKQWIEQDGEVKKAYVIEQYHILPARVKSILIILAPIFRFKNGQDLWAWLVQRVFDWIKKKVAAA